MLRRFKLSLLCQPILWFAVGVISCLLIHYPSDLLANKGTHRVLILNSYHQGYPYTDAAVAAVRRVFEQADLPAELSIEYLDTKRHSPDVVLLGAASLLQSKFPANFFDLIIAADEVALDLALQRRKSLIEDTPVVFFGIQLQEENLPENVTGVVEQLSYADTLQLALDQHPETKRIIYTGNTHLASSRMYNDLFFEQTKGYHNRVDFIGWHDLPVSEVLSRARQLPEDSLIMPISVMLEQQAGFEHLISNCELSGMIRQVSDVPLYVNFRSALGCGAVGGRLVDYPQQGATAAEIGLRILGGEVFDNLPVVELPNEYVFDFKELKRNNINLKELPADSIVINLPVTSYPIEKRYLWLVGVSMLSLITLTLLLLKMIYVRRRVEKRLRKSEQKFRSVFETTAVGMAILSRDWKVLEVNSALCRMLGYAESEFLARDADNFVLDQDQEKIRPLMREVAAGIRQYYHCEKRYCHKSTKIVWGRNSVASVCGEDGLPLYYVSLVQDITEQKLSETELQLSEVKYRNLTREFEALLDGIPDSLVLLSPQMKVVWGNKEAAKILGVDPSALAGCDYPELWKSGDCLIKRCFQSGMREENQVRSDDGRHWEIKAFPLKDRNDEVISVIEMASDVTEKLQLRKESLRSAQLASLGELAAGVAHEINNPINGIINYAQILADEEVQSDSATEILNEVIQEGCRIANIVGGLLSFARQRKDEKEAIAFKEIYHACLTMLESQFLKDGIALAVDFPEDLPHVLAHKQQIQQVILNILSNAHYALNQKYLGCDENKRIKIQARLLAGLNPPCVQVLFKDYGSGIAEDIIDKVVDPFFSTKPIDKGTGLGLSISHGIITDHKGKMTIDSLEGSYTQVSIELPVSNQEGSDHGS